MPDVTAPTSGRHWASWTSRSRPPARRSPSRLPATAPATGPAPLRAPPSRRHVACSRYRVRHGHDGVDETVIARSDDGERFETVAALDETRFDGAMGMERPSLVRTEDGRWRLYTCMATRRASTGGSTCSRRDTLEGLADAEPRHRVRGRPAHRRQGPVRPRAADRRLAGVDLRAPARRRGRRGPDAQRVRDQRRRADMGLARHRARRPRPATGTRAARG